MADSGKIRSIGFGKETTVGTPLGPRDRPAYGHKKIRESERIRKAFEMAAAVVSGTEAKANSDTDAVTAGMTPALQDKLNAILQSNIDERYHVLLDLCGGDMDTARGLIAHMETKRKLENRLAEIIDMEASTK